ncbi:MAG: excalibur calcium-binding domain-containing protein [Proteobacteria bacterium]|nr:excalibur calcium-binding domain-containing protein [Pseudomonadota bacterium]
MKNLFLSIALSLLSFTSFAAQPIQIGQSPSSQQFRCDGRTHCSQMKSCEEAKFFLKSCPGTKMDGDGNGIPCERQWCTSERSDQEDRQSGRRRFK